MTYWLPAGYRAETETEVKRSRFIATLVRVDSEQDARALIAEVRHRYPDARHHCTAYIVEVTDAQPIERSSDDGEPSGTAGTPMLDTLRGADITQAVVVVTRYFGGVLLGTGGLVRAYSDAVAAACAAAPLRTPTVRALFQVSLGYADAGRFEDDLRNAGGTVDATDYGGSGVTLDVSVPAGFDVAALAAASTHGAAACTPMGTLRG